MPMPSAALFHGHTPCSAANGKRRYSIRHVCKEDHTRPQHAVRGQPRRIGEGAVGLSLGASLAGPFKHVSFATCLFLLDALSRYVRCGCRFRP